MKLINLHPNAKSHASVNPSMKGQGLTEYAIILALIAIAAIGAASYFGDAVKANFVALGSELTTGTDYDMVGATSDAFNKADVATTSETSLQNYRD